MKVGDGFQCDTVCYGVYTLSLILRHDNTHDVGRPDLSLKVHKEFYLIKNLRMNGLNYLCKIYSIL